MAATLTPVVQFWTLALRRVPSTLMIVTSTITRTETSRATSGERSTSWSRYLENATASVASEPLLMTKKSVQP